MAEAIYAGLLTSSTFSKEQICFTNRSPKRSKEVESKFGLTFLSTKELISSSEIILICTKPQKIDELLELFPRNWNNSSCIVSILSGISTQKFHQALGENVPIVLAMPNMPVIVGQGMTALYKGKHVSSNQWKIVSNIFASSGSIIEVKNEYLINVVIGISGSGPAFFYRLSSEIAKLGLEEGLDLDTSLKLIAQTLIGSGTMLLQSGKSPENLVLDVSSPNGTTVAGLKVFDQEEITRRFQSVIHATIKRAVELGS